MPSNLVPHLNIFSNNGEKTWYQKFLASDVTNFTPKALNGAIIAKATENGLEKNIPCPKVAVTPKDIAKLSTISEEELPSLKP